MSTRKKQEKEGTNTIIRDRSPITEDKSERCITITIADGIFGSYGIRKGSDVTLGHFIWDYHYLIELGDQYHFGLTHQFEYIANEDIIKWQGNLINQSDITFTFKDNVLQRVGTDEKWALDESAFKAIRIGQGSRTLKCYGYASSEHIKNNELHILFIVDVLFRLLHANPPYFPLQ